jgi:signal transduction histidine kinase
MNTMLERIETASAAQRRLVADASHELRSPLATIHANADLLDAAPLPDASARSVARIHAESRRMGKLVDDLMLLARVDDDKLRRPAACRQRRAADRRRRPFEDLRPIRPPRRQPVAAGWRCWARAADRPRHRPGARRNDHR